MEIDWHARFTEQARWTKPLRNYLLHDFQISPDSYCLEVGSGTGVISADFAASQPCKMVGIDLDFDRCESSTRNYQNISVLNGDAFQLPFPSDTFDCVFCHYFLLWIRTARDALDEIFRVLKPGGNFFAFAEPDYNARIDHPASLQPLGKLQTESLVDQGVNPTAGRELPSMAITCGFTNCKFGISGYEQSTGVLPDWWSSEWDVIKQDLEPHLDRQSLSDWQQLDRNSWLNGMRILWVPTFYLSCNKPLN